MKKLLSVFILFLVMAGSAMACHVQVHVEDEQGNDMQSVDVALASSCGWGPAGDDTDPAGWTTDWAVWKSCLYTASVPVPPEGHVCDTGAVQNTGGADKIYLTCIPAEVPEFGVLAAVGMLGLAGLFLYRKRQ